MYRHIYTELQNWKERPNRKPLILKGVRQCGKTWLLKEFAARNFADVAYFNFEGNEQLQDCFEKNLDVRRIVRELGQIRHKAIDADTTVVVFDEIQFCPNALTSLKYFQENLPGLAILCAGSLLGLALAKPYSFPVGKVTFLTLYPMNFSEFLLACGEEYLSAYLRELPVGEKIPSALFTEFWDRYREYLLVGGMPEAVLTWVETQDLESVDRVLDDILQSYELDFAKHAPAAEFPKLSAIWRSVPQQLSRENKKFVYSEVLRGGRARNLSDALGWLISAGLIHQVGVIDRPVFPLQPPADSASFKVYVCDAGLLRRMSRFPADGFLSDRTDLSYLRGAIAENFVLTELVSASGEVPVCWRSGNSAEVEFVIQAGENIVPVEVKAGVHTMSRSLRVYRERFHPGFSVRLSRKNAGRVEEEGVLVSLPLFLAGELRRFL